jgi:hypothetical protein
MGVTRSQKSMRQGQARIFLNDEAEF